MRGTLRRKLKDPTITGIIPADAGNTTTSDDSLCDCWDHPRGCGEHYGWAGGVDLSEGSSPRMRGTLTRGFSSAVDGGIIPADAGNTAFRHGMPVQLWDHPRGCGEHWCNGLAVSTTCGSSPRMRGTQVTQCVFYPVMGIIPADAGNTGRFIWFVF